MSKEKIEYNGNEYLVGFVHEQINESFMHKGAKVKGFTKAFIKEAGKEGQVIDQAYAHCSVKDQFNKKIGRMISKGRLFKKLGLK